MRATVPLCQMLVITAALLLTSEPFAFVGAQMEGDSDVISVCPDGTRCDRGKICVNTGRVNSNGLDEYSCTCDDVEPGFNCERAPEVFCIKGLPPPDPTGTQNYCVNQGNCKTVVKTDAKGEQK